MYKFKHSFIALGGLFLLIGAIALATPRQTQGQRDEPVGPTKPVKVVNTAGEPVPVAGTVTVGNLGGSPLPVYNVDEPGRAPYQETKLFFLQSPPNVSFTTVPAGKRLVITRVSADLTMPTGVPIVGLRLEVGQEFHYFNAVFVGNTGADNYRVNDELLAYADGGTTPMVSVRSNLIQPPAFQSFLTLSGYFVDVP